MSAFVPILKKLSQGSFNVIVIRSVWTIENVMLDLTGVEIHLYICNNIISSLNIFNIYTNQDI